MSVRRLPVRPDLEQLKHQAKDLLRAVREGDPAALEEFREHHPRQIDPASVKLADAQLVLARSYQAPSWPRLVVACELVDAIWSDDVEVVRAIIARHPQVLHEHVLIRKDSNWGPPMTYAANLGHDRVIAMLHKLGARDMDSALGRATLQGRIGTAKILHRLLGGPVPPRDALGGPAYTLSAEGTLLLFELGVTVRDADGSQHAPVDVVLETDSRKPREKHEILELYARHGFVYPDTPPMALHRGRVDLLEEHLRRDPAMLTRTFRFEEIYPPELGCHDEVLATHGTPLKGATLLHMAVDYDEFEIAEWLLARGMPVDARAAVDEDGFGGHTALFSTVVSQPNFWMNYQGGWAHSRKPKGARFTRLLLDHGADPNVRASLRKQLHPGYGPDTMREYRDVTPLSWGERFHGRLFVSEPAIELIREAGGV